MFCPSCGTQIPDGSQFCLSCGAKTTAPSVSHQTTLNAQEPKKLNAIDALIITVSVAILIAGCFLPLFKLDYWSLRQSTYTLSLFGDNYMANFDCREEILSIMNISLVLSFTSIIAVNIFGILKRKITQCIFAIVNIITILICNTNISSIWLKENSTYNTAKIGAQAGMVIFIIGSIVILVLTALPIIRTKLRNSSSDLPVL